VSIAGERPQEATHGAMLPLRRDFFLRARSGLSRMLSSPFLVALRLQVRHQACSRIIGSH
jgi:hypothetical protein